MPKLAFDEQALEESLDGFQCHGFLWSQPFTDCELVTTTDSKLACRVEIMGSMQTIEVPDGAAIENGLLTWNEVVESRNIKQTIAIKF